MSYYDKKDFAIKSFVENRTKMMNEEDNVLRIGHAPDIPTAGDLRLFGNIESSLDLIGKVKTDNSIIQFRQNPFPQLEFIDDYSTPVKMIIEGITKITNIANKLLYDVREDVYSECKPQEMWNRFRFAKKYFSIEEEYHTLMKALGNFKLKMIGHTEDSVSGTSETQSKSMSWKSDFPESITLSVPLFNMKKRYDIELFLMPRVVNGNPIIETYYNIEGIIEEYVQETMLKVKELGISVLVQ